MGFMILYRLNGKKEGGKKGRGGGRLETAFGNNLAYLIIGEGAGRVCSSEIMIDEQTAPLLWDTLPAQPICRAQKHGDRRSPLSFAIAPGTPMHAFGHFVIPRRRLIRMNASRTRPTRGRHTSVDSQAAKVCRPCLVASM